MRVTHRSSVHPSSMLAALHVPASMTRSRDREGSVGIPWWRSARAAFFAGLGRPWLWPWALVAFLLRGGIVLFLLPIVVLPSTVGVATFIGPMAITAAGPTDYFIGLIAVAFAALGVWLVVGGLLAAWAERRLIEEALLGDRAVAPIGSSVGTDPTAAADLAPWDDPGRREFEPSTAPGGRAMAVLTRMLLVRLVADVPLAAVLAWAAARIGTIGYDELTAPGEVATALPLRVLARAADVLAITVAVWLLAEVVGGIATRRVLLRGESVPGALLFAVLDVVRRPVTTLLSALLPLAGAIVLVGPSLVATWMAWGRLRFALESGLVVAAIVLVMLFVAIWVLGLVLAGAAAAWRATAWTFESLRANPESSLAKDRPTLAESGLASAPVK